MVPLPRYGEGYRMSEHTVRVGQRVELHPGTDAVNAARRLAWWMLGIVLGAAGCCTLAGW